MVENTSGNLCNSKGTVNIIAAEKKSALLCYGPDAGLVIKSGFLYPSLNPRALKGKQKDLSNENWQFN